MIQTLTSHRARSQAKKPQDDITGEQSPDKLLRRAPCRISRRSLRNPIHPAGGCLTRLWATGRTTLEFSAMWRTVSLGDCKEEAAVHDLRLRQITKEKFLSAFQTLPLSDYTALFKAYGFDPVQNDYGKCVTMARVLINDSRYVL